MNRFIVDMSWWKDVATMCVAIGFAGLLLAVAWWGPAPWSPILAGAGVAPIFAYSILRNSAVVLLCALALLGVIGSTASLAACALSLVGIVAFVAGDIWWAARDLPRIRLDPDAPRD
jgi:hypothetical protein